jgi:isocitrate/isopropylmalate dehydrogenase
MMLDYLGFGDAAQRLDNAVSAVYAQGQYLTPNQGGKGLTTGFCQAVKEHL